MGQENSSPLDEATPPQTLEFRTVDGLAKYIKDGRARKIVVMSGAGISTSAGIPDFRSPETGLYANLARLNLPYAEAVFSIDYFRQKPEPFYELASELFPGKFRPTITHSFITLLWKKGLLLKHFTQNIDCLDREAGLPGEMTIEAHGSFATQRCIDCKTEYPDEEMLEKVRKKDIPRCKSCNGLVKPDIVFFGEALPAEFGANRFLPAESDLCIVMGTSLTVMPFAALPQAVREETPRLLINLERVGGMGSRRDDVLLLEDCDSGVRKLAEALGWLEELEEMWDATGAKFGVEPRKKEEEEDNGKEKSKDEKLEAEIEKLTKDVDATLRLAETHEGRIRSDFENKDKKDLERKMKQGDQSTTLAAPLTKSEGDGVALESPSTTENAKGKGLSHIFGHLKGKPSL